MKGFFYSIKLVIFKFYNLLYNVLISYRQPKLIRVRKDMVERPLGLIVRGVFLFFQSINRLYCKLSQLPFWEGLSIGLKALSFGCPVGNPSLFIILICRNSHKLFNWGLFN